MLRPILRYLGCAFLLVVGCTGCSPGEPASVPVTASNAGETKELPVLKQNEIFMTNRPEAVHKKDTSFQDLPDELETVSEADRKLMEVQAD